MDHTLFDAAETWVDLPYQVDASLADDLEKHSVYVSPDLASLRVSPDRTRMSIRLRPRADEAAVRGKLDRYVTSMLAGFRKIEPHVQFRRERRGASELTPGVYDELRWRGWLFEHGTGQVSLAGPALNLSRAIDDHVAALFQERFQAVPRAFPAMVRAELLARCGYFEMHPNSVSFVSHLVEDFDAIEQFRQANTGRSPVDMPDAPVLAPSHQCLTPAGCLPSYEALEGKMLPLPGMALSLNGRAFRYESRNMSGLDCLWEFSMRELVLLGGEEYVRAGCRAAVGMIAELVEAWDLDGRIETASDPFFAAVHGPRTFFQRSLDIKQELRLAVAPGVDGVARTVAASSINQHGTFFGSRFGITTAPGKDAFSACIGFGLERWVLGCFSQHGFEPGRWPAGLRDKVFRD